MAVRSEESVALPRMGHEEIRKAPPFSRFWRKCYLYQMYRFAVINIRMLMAIFAQPAKKIKEQMREEERK